MFEVAMIALGVLSAAAILYGCYKIQQWEDKAVCRWVREAERRASEEVKKGEARE